MDNMTTKFRLHDRIRTADHCAWIIVAHLVALSFLTGCENNGAPGAQVEPQRGTPAQVTSPSASSALDDGELPSAGEVFERYVEVTGGKAAYEKLHNSIAHCTSTSGAREMKLVIHQQAPDGYYQYFEFASGRKLEAGSDGQTVWNKLGSGRYQLIYGAKKAASLRVAAFNEPLRMAALLENTECVGLAEFNGQGCYKVVATPAKGFKEELLYGIDSGLLLSRGITRRTGAGDVLSTIKEFADYKETEGVLTARTVTKKQSLRDRTTGSERTIQETVTKVERLEYNVAIPEGRFDLPEGVKELLATKQARITRSRAAQPTTQPADIPASQPASESDEP